MVFMDIEIKTLHLCRGIAYQACASSLFPDAALLAKHAREQGECLLVFDDTAFIIDTPDGPRVNGIPASRALFAIESAASDPAPFGERTDRFVLEQGDYAFFQTRYHGTAEGSEWIRSLFEEFVRQLWWEQVTCHGPWILRLVPEDEEIAFQTLRRIA